MYDYMLWFIAGVLIGWLTKIPFLLKFYREWEDEYLNFLQTQKRFIECMKERDGDK